MMHLLLLVLTLLTACPVAAATLYASPTGVASGACPIGAPCSLAFAVTQLDDGDLLLLLNGQYNTALAPVNGQSGSSGNPITVRAVTPGQVLIHGGGVRIPINLGKNNDWWVIEDVDACCSSGSVVSIGSSGNSSNNNIIRWGIFWDGSSGGNFMTVGIQYATNTRVIQNGIFGSGRKGFQDFDTTDTWFHNNVVMKTFQGPSNGGICASWSYKNRSFLGTNNILMCDIQGGNQAIGNIFGPDHYTGTGYIVPTTTHTLKGNIVLHHDAQGVGDASVAFKSGINTQQINSGTGGHITVTSDNSLIMRRNAASPAFGMLCGQDGPNSTCIRDHWTDSVGTLTGGTHSTDGTAITPSAAPDLLRLASATQPANGAWIRYLYDSNGTLTATAAWPWGGAKGMAARLQARLTQTSWGTKGLNGSGQKNIDAVIQSATGSSFSAVPITPVLLFTQQPQTTQAGATIPGFEVCVYDDPVTPVKQLNWTATMAVTLNHPTGGALTGTTTRAPLAGCVTFNNLSVDTVCVGCTLLIASTGATGITSNPFNITAVTTPPVTGTLILTVPR